MVLDDDALELHITGNYPKSNREENSPVKHRRLAVHGQNLSAIPERCNTGTLRLPSDPSWPKIPPRRLTDHPDDVVKAPYVVTVTGTPRRNRSTIQTVEYQCPKSSLNKKYEAGTHAPERSPGCIDPRFKRQVSRQKVAEEEEPAEAVNAKRTKEEATLNREEAARSVCAIPVPTEAKVSQRRSTRSVPVANGGKESSSNDAPRPLRSNTSRKAKSFLRKRSRLATTDSDCTLMLPGPRRGAKGKRYRCERTRERFRAGQLSRRRNWLNGGNSTRAKCGASKRNRRSALGSLRADDPLVPPATRELLNKSYWEYYRKLRSSEDPRDEEERLPESRTLQQCSVLSCMINNAIEPTIGGSATRAKRIKRRKTSCKNDWSLGLKAAAFSVVLLYVAIVFSPAVYDYLMIDEEHDDYEDVNYVALTLEYIAASFEEAFGEILGALRAVFVHLAARHDRDP